MNERRSGWVTFSWIMFMLAGLVNTMYGAAALVRKEYFPSGGVIYQAIQQHAWVWLLIGLLQLLVAYTIASRLSFGRWFGIAMAAVAALVWFYYMLYLPNAGLGLFIVYVLVIYGLAAHGDEFA